MVSSQQLYAKVLNSNCKAILIEGFAKKEYCKYVKELTEIVKKNSGRVIDFHELLKQPNENLIDLELKNFIFVYNLDLFGRGIDPDNSTRKMNFLKSQINTWENARELLIASPDANLNYNDKKEFNYFSNHPLGNWCETYKIQNQNLIPQIK